MYMKFLYFFFNDTATTEIYTLSLHDALPILKRVRELDRGALLRLRIFLVRVGEVNHDPLGARALGDQQFALLRLPLQDRKSTRLNSSHANISYAVFCLKKKK